MLLYFSGFFLSSYKILSPVFACFLLYMFFFLCILKVDKKTSFLALFIVFMYVPIIVYQNIFLGLKYGVVNELVRHIFPFVFYLFVSSYLLSKSTHMLLRLAKNFISFNTLLLVMETIFRVNAAGGSGNFYAFKYHSFLYADSNFVALHALSILFLAFALKGFTHTKINKLNMFLLSLVVLLCFSRTAWLVLFVLFYVNFIVKKNKILNAFVLIFGLLFFFILFSGRFFEEALEDGSFKTKMFIFDNFIDFLSADYQTVLLGYGSGNLIDVIGRESHNIWGLTMEMGIIWLFSLIVAYAYIYKCFGKKPFFLLFPVLLSGSISLYPIAYMSLQFSCVALLYFIEKKHKETMCL